MQCPPEIGYILCEILQVGLLRIRTCGWDRLPERCYIEADHLHNLPSLIADFNPKRLDYYWYSEREYFIERSTPDELVRYVALWESLAKHIQSPRDQVIPS